MSIYTPDLRRNLIEDTQRGINPPAAIVTRQYTNQVLLRFNVEASVQFNLGSYYRSAKVSYDPELKEIVIQLSHKKRSRKETNWRTLSHNRVTKQAQISLTTFFSKLGFVPGLHRRYPVSELDAKVIVVALDDWEPASRSGRTKCDESA